MIISGSFDFPRKFWVANRYAINVDFFDEKIATFVLNLEHRDNRTRASFLKRHANYGLDADSINRLYDWLAFQLYNYDTNLYSVTYNQYGIKNTYISSFQSLSEPVETISHTWITSYMWPEKEDIEVFPVDYNYNDGPRIF